MVANQKRGAVVLPVRLHNKVDSTNEKKINFNNLVIVTPKYHKTLLDPKYHYGVEK